jgi:hypothetical protein
LSPIPISFIFILVGMFLLWFTRRQTLGKLIVSKRSLNESDFYRVAGASHGRGALIQKITGEQDCSHGRGCF